MPLRVIALDHDTATVGLYRDLLSEHGYEVTALSRPIDDPEALSALLPDLILLELLVMGELSGPQVIEKLKTHPATAPIPMIVCTAALELLPQVEPLLAKYRVPVVTKPFQIGEFLTVVQRAIASQE